MSKIYMTGSGLSTVEQNDHSVEQHSMEWDTLKEGNHYQMGQDYPVWDTGGASDQWNVGCGVWCIEAAGMFVNWVAVQIFQ